MTPRTGEPVTPAICNYFCGAGHGGMKLKVVVEPAL